MWFRHTQRDRIGARGGGIEHHRDGIHRVPNGFVLRTTVADCFGDLDTSREEELVFVAPLHRIRVATRPSQFRLCPRGAWLLQGVLPLFGHCVRLLFVVSSVGYTLLDRRIALCTCLSI